MSGSTDKTTSAPAPNQAVSENRRRLLKAAAVGAPMIATLKSGAAAATASARQCIANDATATPTGIVEAGDPLIDQYVYQSGEQYKVYDADGVATVYYFVQGGWYTESGTSIASPVESSVACTDDKKSCFESEARYFLALWQPDGTPPTTVTSQCVVPVKSLDDFQALSQSCWSSVAPGTVRCIR